MTGLEEARQEESMAPVFRAFLERRWFWPILVARVALAIMTEVKFEVNPAVGQSRLSKLSRYGG
jgi:hypothetical protein